MMAPAFVVHSIWQFVLRGHYVAYIKPKYFGLTVFQVIVVMGHFLPALSELILTIQLITKLNGKAAMIF